MLSAQQAANDKAKDAVSELERELSVLRAQAHDQAESIINDCMRCDREFGCAQTYHFRAKRMTTLLRLIECCREMMAVRPGLAFTCDRAVEA